MRQIFILTFFLLFFRCSKEQTPNNVLDVDTLYIVSNDTLYNIDTIFNIDTIVIANRDTVAQYDTIFVAADTMFIYDSIYVLKTVVSYDTQYLSTDTLTLVNQVAMNLSGIDYSMDLSFLAWMNRLEWLNLTGAKSESFAPIDNCINLKYLYLRGSSIDSCRYIRNLSKLVHLDLEQCTLADTVDLTYHPEMCYCDLANSRIAYIAPIHDMNYLKSLLLNMNYSGPISIINLPQLSDLKMCASATDVMLQNLPSMETLNIILQGNLTLSDLPKLKTLSISEKSPILIHLEDFPNLRTLTVNVESGSSISLVNLPELQEASFSRQGLLPINCENLPNLKKLTINLFEDDSSWLTLSSTVNELVLNLYEKNNTIGFADISEFKSLKRLKIVQASFPSNISDVNSIAGLDSIEYIYIKGSFAYIEDWSPLYSCLSKGDTLRHEIYSISLHSSNDPSVPDTTISKLIENGVIVIRGDE